MVSRTLTLQTLTDERACLSQAELFCNTFGDSVEVTPELCLSVADKFDWDWAARHLLSPVAWADYDRAGMAALVDYYRAKAPAQAERDRAVKDAWADYDRVTASAQADYARAQADYARAKATAEADYVRAKATAQAERDRAMASAFGKCYAEDYHQTASGAQLRLHLAP